MQFLIRYFYAPVFFVGFVGAALLAINNGLHVAGLIPFLIVAVIISLFAEHMVPYEEDWNRPHGDRLRDIMHAVINEASIVSMMLLLPLIALLRPWPSLWPDDLSLLAQFVIAILSLDIGITLVHYASHRVKFLWRFHAVHHSVERMYGFNGLLKHPIHQALEVSGGVIPWLILGVPFDVAALAGFAVSIQLLLQHSNVDMRIGPLKYFWAIAPVHRHHHRASANEGDVNFGLFVTFWDILLGTTRFESSTDVRAGSIGIEDKPDYPVGYLPQLIEPFQR